MLLVLWFIVLEKKCQIAACLSLIRMVVVYELGAGNYPYLYHYFSKERVKGMKSGFFHEESVICSLYGTALLRR